MTNNSGVEEIKALHKVRVERKAKMIRDLYEDSDDELMDLGVKIRGNNRRSYINQ